MQPGTVLVAALIVLATAQAERSVAAQTAPAAPASSLRTVLVLPLENSGGDPRLDWLGEGLAELTIERLSGEGRAVFSREEVRQLLAALGAKSDAGDRP